MITGRRLYEVWARAMTKRGVEIDSWDMLASTDQEAWDVVAKYTNETMSDAVEETDLRALEDD